MNSKVDGYEHLYQFDEPTSDDVEKLMKEIGEQKHVIHELRQQCEILENANKGLLHENENLSMNISSIFRTAKTELMRKETVIKELQQELDDRRRRTVKMKGEDVDLENDSILIQKLLTRYEKDIDEKYSSKEAGDSCSVDRRTFDSRLQLPCETAKSEREHRHSSSGTSREHNRKHVARKSESYETADYARKSYEKDEGRNDDKKYSNGKSASSCRPRRSNEHHRTRDDASKSRHSTDENVGNRSRNSRSRYSLGDVNDCSSKRLSRNEKRDYHSKDHVSKSRQSSHKLEDDYRRSYDERRRRDDKYLSVICKERHSSGNSSKRFGLKSVVGEVVEHQSSRSRHSRDIASRNESKYSANDISLEKIASPTVCHSSTNLEDPINVDTNVKDHEPSPTAAAVNEHNGAIQFVRLYHDLDYYNTPVKIVKREIGFSPVNIISPIAMTPDHVKDKYEIMKIGPVPMINESRVLEETEGYVGEIKAKPTVQIRNGENKITVENYVHTLDDDERPNKIDDVNLSSTSSNFVSPFKNCCVAQVTNDDLNNSSTTISSDVGEIEHGVFARKRKRPYRVVISL